MTADYEECRKNLENLIAWYKPEHRNEADTRFKVIKLFEVKSTYELLFIVTGPFCETINSS